MRCTCWNYGFNCSQNEPNYPSTSVLHPHRIQSIIFPSWEKKCCQKYFDEESYFVPSSHFRCTFVSNVYFHFQFWCNPILMWRSNVSSSLVPGVSRYPCLVRVWAFRLKDQTQWTRKLQGSWVPRLVWNFIFLCWVKCDVFRRPGVPVIPILLKTLKPGPNFSWLNNTTKIRENFKSAQQPFDVTKPTWTEKNGETVASLVYPYSQLNEFWTSIFLCEGRRGYTLKVKIGTSECLNFLEELIGVTGSPRGAGLRSMPAYLWLHPVKSRASQHQTRSKPEYMHSAYWPPCCRLSRETDSHNSE